MVDEPGLCYCEAPLQRLQDRFEYFRPFEPFEYSGSMEIQEELPIPSSPNSVQSDSDTSISSVEVPSQTIRGLKASPEVESQCRWRSCGLRFPSLDQLASHVAKVHSASGRGGLFYCGWDGCTRNDKGFNARYKMLVHVRTHTNEKPHKCFQCEKSFSRAENLKIHSRSHSGEKPYICPVSGCNKAYSNSSDRFKHTRTHQVDKPYQCKVPGCPKRYTDPSSLRKHVKTYKHFVNEPKPSEPIPVTSQPEEVPREEITTHSYSCNKICCVTSSNAATAEYGNTPSDLFSISALINMKNEETTWNGYMAEKEASTKWNGYMDPYFTEKQCNSKWEGCMNPYITMEKERTMYVGCDVRQEVMDVDAPLDLSVHRRDF
ncbi:unnamed protein product [Callosobruchus maculatus]|nr:unnamed protein product [Callosobruchus maculatus]